MIAEEQTEVIARLSAFDHPTMNAVLGGKSKSKKEIKKLKLTKRIYRIMNSEPVGSECENKRFCESLDVFNDIKSEPSTPTLPPDFITSDDDIVKAIDILNCMQCDAEIYASSLYSKYKIIMKKRSNDEIDESELNVRERSFYVDVRKNEIVTKERLQNTANECVQVSYNQSFSDMFSLAHDCSFHVVIFYNQNSTERNDLTNSNTLQFQCLNYIFKVIF